MPVRRDDRLKATFSIVAADPETGEVGVAVQSKYFAVGNVVPWARAGVGAVATQAAGVAAFGPWALDGLEAGLEPEQALRQVLADDAGRETRQLGAVSAAGGAACWTGSQCNPWAGHLSGAGYAVQGNILAGERVVAELERAWLETSGSFAHRLVCTLEAGQAAGGDVRGQQSAAIVVERLGAAAETREGIDCTVDLRVDDHERPIAELRRLLELHERWEAVRIAGTAYEAGRYPDAATAMEQAVERYGAEPMLLYDLACYRALEGRHDEAVALLRRAVAEDASLRAQARVDEDFASVRERDDFRAAIG